MTALAYSSLPCRATGFIGVEKLNHSIKEHAEIFAFLLCVMVYVSYSMYEKRVTQQVLDNLQINDFVFVDYHAIDPTSNHRFRFIPMRIIDIDEHGATFKVGNIAHTTPVSPWNHVKFNRAYVLRNFYRSEPLFLPHSKIDALRASEAIYNARRPRNIYIDGWAVMQAHEVKAE